MNIELINTGSELLLGRTLNTHQQWLCHRLSDAGYSVTRQMAVPDTAADICNAVREALGRVACVIVTGGLGPTSDDVTREEIARMFRLQLREDAEVVAALTAFCRARGRVLSERMRVQALVPESATVLPNGVGTAPGLALEFHPNPFDSQARDGWLILLPGPPRELHPMFDASVLPLLKHRFSVSEPFTCLTLRTTGLPESQVEDQISGPLSALVSRGLQLGYCARPGEVDVRLSSRGADAEFLTAEAAKVVRDCCATHIFAESDDELESAVISLLQERHCTVAAAESCTGGLIAHRLTNVPGASAVFLGGVVAYANEIKEGLLGVPREMLEQQGAVSEAVCRAMAEGVRQRFQADFGISVTGIAGPSGGTESKPVGTVFIGLAAADGTQVLRRLNRWDRMTFKQVTSQQALDFLRRKLAGHPPA
jgi:nicotinamide-nucleotide amidase